MCTVVCELSICIMYVYPVHILKAVLILLQTWRQATKTTSSTGIRAECRESVPC